MKQLLFALYRGISRSLAGRGLHWGRIPGLWRLHGWALRRLRPRGIVTLNLRGFSLSVNAEDTGVAPSLLSFGVHERYETALFQQAIRPGMVVVDAGANAGYYTLVAARATGPEGRVFSFEPVPENYALLRRNVEQNGIGWAVCSPCALSDRQGMTSIHTDRDNRGMASLSNLNIPNRGTSLQAETTTLDDFLGQQRGVARVDVVKIDVEGAEALVLNGARRTLSQCRPTIFLEACVYAQKNIGTDPARMFADLTDLGYRFQLIDEQNRRLVDIGVDTILQHCDRHGTADLVVSSAK